jgi:hypothetical protein
MSRPVQKRCKIIPSGNDKSRLACINVENQAQAAPIDSSRCSKSRIALGREPIQDMGKNKTKLVLKFILVPIHAFYGICVPLFHPPHERDGK